MMLAPIILSSPLLPSTGDSLRPLIIALIVFGVAVVAIIALMFMRRRK